MPTQLEIILSALESSLRPMTAAELAGILRENGSKAEKPENTVLSIVHRCRDIVNVGGSPARYCARGLAGRLGVSSVGRTENALKTAFMKEMAARCKFCRTEADVREKIVVPVLERALGYSVAENMSFEMPLNDEKKERPDIVVTRGRKRLFVVEIKKLGSDLSKAEGQLRRYFRMIDKPAVRAGILTDGIRWRFFLRELRAGTVDAVPYAEGDLGNPAPGFVDALSDLEAESFNADILVQNSRCRAKELENSQESA